MCECAKAVGRGSRGCGASGLLTGRCFLFVAWIKGLTGKAWMWRQHCFETNRAVHLLVEAVQTTPSWVTGLRDATHPCLVERAARMHCCATCKTKCADLIQTITGHQGPSGQQNNVTAQAGPMTVRLSSKTDRQVHTVVDTTTPAVLTGTPMSKRPQSWESTCRVLQTHDRGFACCWLQSLMCQARCIPSKVRHILAPLLLPYCTHSFSTTIIAQSQKY